MTFGTQVLLLAGDMSQATLMSAGHSMCYRKEAAFVCKFNSAGAPTGTLQMVGSVLQAQPAPTSDDWVPLLNPYTITGLGRYTFDITATGFLWLAVLFTKSGSSTGALSVYASSKGQG